MKKVFKEFMVLVLLPLVLMSMSLAVIGTSHSTIMTHTNRITKLKHESNDIPISCEVGLCQDIQNFFL